MPASVQRLTDPATSSNIEDESVERLFAHAAALGAAGDAAAAAEALGRARALHSEAVLRESGVDMTRLTTDSAYAVAIGRTLYNRWSMAAAVVALTHAARDPARRLEAQFVLGQALHYLGRVREAEDVFRAMLDGNPAAYGYLLYALFFRCDGGKAHFEEVRRWANRVVDRLPILPPPLVERRSDRRLRIGYLTPTLNNQLRHFLNPVLENHDPTQVEVFMYVDSADAEVEIPDVTMRSVRDVTHSNIAKLIRADKIDVLIDLDGHFRLGRPLTFALRPAPVQISWMNYTHTVGFKAMDYVLHGDHMDTPGAQELFAETIYNVGPVMVPFRPTPTARLSPAPSASKGYVTFGSFNHPAKVTDPTVAAWARILKACPTAKLVLKYSVFADPVLCAETTARFVAQGASADQLLFRGHSKGEAYEQAFEEIDIALDPSPVTGGTTTMEAVSRGVPVISLQGDDYYARVGMQALMAMGMPELVGETWDDYVRIAVDLAGDLAAVEALRARTRPALDASPYRDEVGFTRRLEAAFREMFDRWLASPDSARIEAAEASAAPTISETVLLAKTELLDGHTPAALRRLDAMIQRDPASFELHYWRASALMAAGEADAGEIALDQGRTFHAVAVLREMGVDMQRVRSDPAFAGAAAFELYGHKLVALASVAFSCGISLESPTEQGLLSLGLSLQHQGRAEEAANVFRATADLFNSSAAYQFLLYSLFFVPDGVTRYAAEARAWAQRFTGDIQPLPEDFANPRNADRRLKIGFVAPSFTRSQLKQFIMPVALAHDPAAVDLHFYSANPGAEDALPGMVRGIGGLNDLAAAKAIRADRIDILIDLWGFTAGGRLGVFAYKPAPIQAAWINFVQTTGLPAMDYVLHADSMDAPGTDALFTEKVLHVGPVTVPYQPLPGRLPPTPTPAASAGHITFGSFNNPARISDETVAAWARILKGRRGSRLLLKYGYYDDPVLRRVVQARFAAHGVDPACITFAGHSTGTDYLASFGGIDLALDPSPCPGGTTTCDALANSVPVLTLRGGDFYSRIGVAAVQALPELIAEDWDDYVARALALTADVQALDALRARVRPTFEASPVCDAHGFTRRLEQTYREMFSTWANRNGD
jgi:protein O-GlcNAc transferase